MQPPGKHQRSREGRHATRSHAVPRAVPSPPIPGFVKGFDLFGEFGCRAVGHRSGRYRGDRQHGDRCGHPPLGQPFSELSTRRRVHDAPETGPRVRGRTHRALLTRRVQGCPNTMHRSQIRGRPSNNAHLGMQCLVVVGDPVVVLIQGPAFGVDQDRAERCVPLVQSRVSEFDTAPQMVQIDLAHAHRPEVYGLLDLRRHTSTKTRPPHCFSKRDACDISAVGRAASSRWRPAFGPW